MEVRKFPDGTIAIELKQHEDIYYVSTYQARWKEGLLGARFNLHLYPETVKELLEKLKEAL